MGTFSLSDFRSVLCSSDTFEFIYYNFIKTININIYLQLLIEGQCKSRIRILLLKLKSILLIRVIYKKGKFNAS